MFMFSLFSEKPGVISILASQAIPVCLWQMAIFIATLTLENILCLCLG